MRPIERPLRLGEVLAETIRIYGERLWAAFGLGAFAAGSFLLAFLTGHIVPFVILAAIAFTAAFAAAARLASGDRFVEAWAQVALRLPVLLVLTVVVAVPFVIGRIDPILLIFAVAWLALTGFSIPVAMLERDPQAERWYSRLSYSLWRSLQLARVEYLHALGVSAALVLVYLVLGSILGRALVGLADNAGAAANVLVQIVLAPLFFLGLSVLYFEQNARAVSSRR